MDSGIEKLPCIPGKGGTEEEGRGSALLGAGDLFPSNPQVVHAREEYTSMRNPRCYLPGGGTRTQPNSVGTTIPRLLPFPSPPAAT